MRNVKVAVIKNENPLTREVIYTLISSDVEMLKYSSFAKIVEMPEGDVAEYKRSLSEFVQRQLKLQEIFNEEK